MTNSPRRLGLTVLALALLSAGCGDSNDQASPTVADDAAGAPTVAPAATQPPVLSSDIPLQTIPPYDSGDIPVPLPPVDSSDVPIIITVTVGVDSSADRIETVPLGSTVSLTVVNPGADDEFHLHGFELGDDQVIPAGQSQTFTFAADRQGEFELESHETTDILLTLKVG